MYLVVAQELELDREFYFIYLFLLLWNVCTTLTLRCLFVRIGSLVQGLVGEGSYYLTCVSFVIICSYSAYSVH